MNEDLKPPPECPGALPVREKVVVWCECGETAEGAVERHCLAYPEHRNGDRFEVIVAGWCDGDVWIPGD